MSSSEGGPEKVRVTVDAPDDTEIFVIDSAFNLRARGLGGLDEELEPGLYKLKFKVGSLIREVHEVVEAGRGRVELGSPPLEFASPAPLADTGTTHEYQEATAARLSREVHRRIAPGSQVFLFARAFTGHTADPNRPGVGNPARGLTLHDLDGALLVDFEQDAQAGSGADASAGYTVELAPGAYRLRVRTSQWGSLEQAIVASAGWQTQVFLWQTDDDGGRVPDLSGASILMAEVGTGFTADSDGLRSSELARAALADRKVFMPRHQLKAMLRSDVDDPMTGLYAAHALVAARQADPELLGAVIDKLGALLGTHPDVEALKLFVGGAGATDHRYMAPPMLATSWSLVTSASARRPELVPRASLAARAATALWGDGPWLIWLADELADHGTPTGGVGLREAVSRLTDIASGVPSDDIGVPQVVADLSPLEEALLSAVSPRTRPRTAGIRADPASFETAVAERLGVPPAALEDVAASLLSKLEEPSTEA